MYLYVIQHYLLILCICIYILHIFLRFLMNLLLSVIQNLELIGNVKHICVKLYRLCIRRVSTHVYECATQHNLTLMERH